MVSDFIVHLLRSWVNSITFLKARNVSTRSIKFNNKNHVIAGISQVRKRKKSKFLYNSVHVYSFAPGEPQQSVEPYDYRAVLFFFFIWKEVPFLPEVSGVKTSPSLVTDELKMALRSRKVSGALEKRAIYCYTSHGASHEVPIVTLTLICLYVHRSSDKKNYC